MPHRRKRVLAEIYDISMKNGISVETARRKVLEYIESGNADDTIKKAMGFYVDLGDYVKDG